MKNTIPYENATPYAKPRTTACAHKRCKGLFVVELLHGDKHCGACRIRYRRKVQRKIKIVNREPPPTDGTVIQAAFRTGPGDSDYALWFCYYNGSETDYGWRIKGAPGFPLPILPIGLEPFWWQHPPDLAKIIEANKIGEINVDNGNI